MQILAYLKPAENVLRQPLPSEKSVDSLFANTAVALVIAKATGELRLLTVRILCGPPLSHSLSIPTG